jgi:hypothetical protein
VIALTADQEVRLTRLLTEYCANHPNTEDTYGVSCDERGCSICNADSPEAAAKSWIAQWREDPEVDDDGCSWEPAQFPEEVWDAFEKGWSTLEGGHPPSRL